MELQIILQVRMFEKEVGTSLEMWEKFPGLPAFHTILDTFP